uniref:Cell cycle checkpoint control protein RAD9A n=1 Tax=Spongospora subterranea TaxID=70186 RepID=A0A0H5QVC9_9EUKA|eukprot:CRZ05551.1 hypothetical protein [Spongospora subterranea]
MMDADISSQNITILSRALHCMGRIAGSVIIEVTSAGILWRVLNDSQSSYASLQLSASFFRRFDHGSYNSIKCRLPVRNLLWSLRPRMNAHVKDSNVSMRLDADGLSFEFSNVHGFEQKLYICSDDIPGSIYSHNCDKRSMPNALSASAKWLHKTLDAFHPLLKEITFQALPNELIIRSYVDDTAFDDPNILQTEVRLLADDFELYRVAESSSCASVITVKDLKSVLAFCESVSINMHMFFSVAGDPILLSSADLNDCSDQWVFNVAISTFASEDGLSNEENIVTPEVPATFLTNQTSVKQVRQVDKPSKSSSTASMSQTESEMSEDDVPGTPPPPQLKRVRSS